MDNEERLKRAKDIAAIKQTIEEAKEIRIVTGEGTQGSLKPYTGKRTLAALKAALTDERCGGDRWARAEERVNEHSWVAIEGL